MVAGLHASQENRAETIYIYIYNVSLDVTEHYFCSGYSLTQTQEDGMYILPFQNHMVRKVCG